MSHNKNEKPEFIPGKSYRLGYRPLKTQEMDITLECPKCGNTIWIYQDRTGSKKLGKDQMKLKCTECGLFFICNKDSVTQQLV